MSGEGGYRKRFRREARRGYTVWEGGRLLDAGIVIGLEMPSGA